jgi:1,2-diacylglycerol 3-alpha-glucosyltransferase
MRYTLRIISDETNARSAGGVRVQPQEREIHDAFRDAGYPQRQLKIAIFTEVYRPIVNGVVTSVDSLADHLRRLGHDVYTFAPHIPKGAETSGRVFRMPSLPLPARTEYRLTLPLVSRKNKRAFLGQCDVIHSHSLFITGWMASYYARRRFRVPLVFTYHTLLENYAHYSPLGKRLTSQLTRELTRTYANAADAVIVPTQAVATQLRKRGVTAPLCVVPTGIDIDAFRGGDAARGMALRALHGIPLDAPLVLLVSRLAHEKNVPLVLAALASLRRRLPAVRLLLVGAGPLLDALKVQAADQGLAGAVSFAGSVEHTELPAYYSAADAFAFPSSSETQGLVLAEAFAAGLPVVAVDTPQTRDVFGIHLAGALVPDADSMAQALFELLTSPDRRAAASAHSRAAAVQFDARATAGRVFAVYNAVLANKAGLADMSAFDELFEVVDPGMGHDEGREGAREDLTTT